MIYDCFTFFNELDILEMRLNILDSYVDKFVLVEALETFSGKLKPLYYEQNKKKFIKWKDKIIHHVVTFKVGTNDSFERAFLQKEQIKVALNGIDSEDIVYYGDVDEIWKPQKMITGVQNLEQLNYCYYLNMRSSERWVGTICGLWGFIRDNTLAHWRATHTHEVKNGGWHFTNMGGIEQITKKIEAYDHQENNEDDVFENLETRLRNEQDYIGRYLDWEGKPFSFHIDESELPKYLLDNKDKYKHLWK